MAKQFKAARYALGAERALGRHEADQKAETEQQHDQRSGKFDEAQRQFEVDLREGVYVAVAGPNLETRAEYRMLRMIGADVVGMSTVPEVLVAAHGGMRVLGISIITDMCLPDELEPASLDRILAVAAESEPRLTSLTEGILQRLEIVAR